MFPRRAVIQVFEREDGSIQMPPDYQPVAAELRRRGTVEVVTQTTEQFLGTNSATAGRGSDSGLMRLVDRHTLVVGDFTWTRAALERLGVEMPEPPDYPKCLSHLLRRRIWTSTLGAVRQMLAERAASGPHKQVRTSVFLRETQHRVFSDGLVVILSSETAGVHQAWCRHKAVLCHHRASRSNDRRIAGRNSRHHATGSVHHTRPLRGSSQHGVRVRMK